MELSNALAREFHIGEDVAKDILQLLDEGNTVPFIARYRKERTGDMGDATLRKFEARKGELEKLAARKDTILRTVSEQGKLTPALKQAVESAEDAATLEDLYRPYKPKRRTRATAAREAGYGPLAEEFMSDRPMAAFEEALSAFDGDTEEARSGVMDIVAEEIQNDPTVRNVLKKYLRRSASLTSAAGKTPDGKYEMYEDFSLKLRRLKGHHVLALGRGEANDALSIKIEADEEMMGSIIAQVIKPPADKKQSFERIAEDALKRLLFPSLEREIRRELRESAREDAIEVFAKNLKPLLMTPPLGHRVVLGIDPGNRTGCKVAVVDENGRYLDQAVIYPTPPRSDYRRSADTLMRLIARHGVEVIAVGSGTASYETEQFLGRMIEEEGADISYAIVNEDGASIYSASPLGIEEFPDLDVTIRGAISIARRLQDPLAELVKIEPRHIGVGQYQHDLDEKALDTRLSGVVEGAVNEVGVDVNLASVSLLSHVSGIGDKLARNIVEYRETNGAFRNRNELKSVKGLGPKAFEQSAGFLRIAGGEEMLDATGVHPESYPLARILLKEEASASEKEALASAGHYTLSDIQRELEKPGRDIREDGGHISLKRSSLSMADLKPGLVLEGIVRNVVDFGAFLDIGVKKDGLLHRTEITKSAGDNIYKRIQVGDRMEVIVLEADPEKERISLGRKGKDRGKKVH
ncbi:30S ribosomal protein S1 [Aedoeadaptatus ivorii]|uniref:30S ribosomal protein S1 n=1 Tax=Aedoeadaptatus ivorii TaxID=54006 RepID=A0A448V241_9FIRM|nr:Tex-like N-terminal domain-containing protein [Peptoniphilus ivorii]MDQ0508166.1 uncharacterized protein [Peptoniphilus ivorii]VEJ35896.1 30S ribosomal protein S1 [Peptoniphilus ivorii]